MTVFQQASRTTRHAAFLFPPLYLFLFARTPSLLTMGHYHPPTCKANLALTSLHAPLCHGHGLGKKYIYHRSGKKIKRKQRGGTNSSTCINSHTSCHSFFFCHTTLLHSPVVDTVVEVLIFLSPPLSLDVGVLF